MTQILGDKALMEKLGRGALETASEHSLEKSTEKLLAIYEGLIKA